MARLYTNENFPVPIALELRRLGHDMLTIQETGKAGRIGHGAASDQPLFRVYSRNGSSECLL